MQQETDMLWMTALIFVPTVFALGLLFFPSGGQDEASQQKAKNAMRWWSLFGTALTLGISLAIFVSFQRNVTDTYLTSGGDKTMLGERIKMAESINVPDTARKKSEDWYCRYPWISRFSIQYYLGLDGISMALLLLTTVVTFLSMIASWNIDRYVRGYCMLFLVLETGMIGTFLALDFFLFYVFWEVMLLPMYFLIGVWGGPRREYAAIKFFLYTLLGSVFILIALLAFYFTDVNVGDLVPGAPRTEDKHTFDLILLQDAGRYASKLIKENDALDNARKEQQAAEAGTDAARINQARSEVARLQAANTLAQAEARLETAKKGGDPNTVAVAQKDVERLNQSFFSSRTFQITMFLLLFVGFAIKVPVFPFHTWLPDAHVEAPTPISMILAGVLLKMGGYGILRIAYPICPWAAEILAWYVSLFGIINIVYGAFAAMAQTDFKKLVAYSSISHMGYVILGIAVWSAGPDRQSWIWGMNGAMYQMIAHGITSPAMFFLVGVIYDRAHHRNLDNFRGLYEPMPFYSGISAVIFFGAMGLPGLCGFWGEAWVVLATWRYDKLFAVLAALTVVITAAYILWTIQRVFLGTNPAYKNYTDMDLREYVCIIPLVVLCVVLGVYPMALLSWMDPAVTGLVNQLARLGQ